MLAAMVVVGVLLVLGGAALVSLPAFLVALGVLVLAAAADLVSDV